MLFSHWCFGHWDHSLLHSTSVIVLSNLRTHVGYPAVNQTVDLPHPLNPVIFLHGHSADVVTSKYDSIS